MKATIASFIALLLLLSCGAGSIITTLKEPSFDKHYESPDLQKRHQEGGFTMPDIKLELVKQEPADSISFGRWFQKNNLSLAARVFHDEPTMVCMQDFPTVSWANEFKAFKKGKTVYNLSHIVEQDQVIHFFYGKLNNLHIVTDISILVIRDKRNKEVLHTLDFSNFGLAPDYLSREKGYVFQSARWAQLDANILYVSNAHWRFSTATKDQNGYITAIDLTRKEILWRTEPKVSNAINFISWDRMLITGYGFTREEACLYAIDKGTGNTITKLQIAEPKTGKKHIEYLIKKQNKIYAKTFDNTEYIVSVKK